MEDEFDLLIDHIFREMDEFLRRCEAEGKPATDKERSPRAKQFSDTLKRRNAQALEIYNCTSLNEQ